MSNRTLAYGLLAGAAGVAAMTLTEKIEQEQVIDLVHKAVYAFATGAFADRLVASRIAADTTTRQAGQFDGPALDGSEHAVSSSLDAGKTTTTSGTDFA